MKTTIPFSLSCVPFIFGLLLAGAASALAESASVLLEKGIYTEDTVGDIDGAMKIYEQILAETDANRRYAAQARLRLGLCHLKKQQTSQAQEQFEKLVAEYPEQTELVAEARKRLPKVEFPEIQNCRVIQRVEVTLPSSGKAEAGKPAATIYEDDALEVAWTAPAEVAGKTKAWLVGVKPADSDEKDITKWTWSATIVDVSKRSVRFGPTAKPMEAGPCLLTVIASDTAEGIGEKNYLAAVEAKFTRKPAAYSQINVDDIRPDGTIEGRNIIHQMNESDKPIETLGFMNSDFVQTKRMADASGEPIEFTTRHDGNTFRYSAKLNKPVAPGELLVYSSDSSMAGLIKPVRGKKGVFEYRMQHWPNAGQPTRRIEIYRLPAGAKVVQTTPANMPRRVKDGRTELYVEKLIPAGGSILTVIRYELPEGAAALATQAAKLEIKPAPWADGEEMQLRIMSVAGAEFGTIVYWAESMEVDGRPMWHVQSDMFIAVTNMLQYTCVLAEKDSFAPAAAVTRNSELGQFKGVYGRDSVELTAKSDGKDNKRTIDIGGPVYDNEQVLYLIRRLPLANGYQARFDIFPVMGGAVMEGRIQVTGTEKIAVPAGSYDCFAIALSVWAEGSRVLEHHVWVSADTHRYLVKYDSEAALMELTKVATQEKTKPVEYNDAALKLSLQAPAGWHFYKNAASGSQVTVQLLVPQQKAWALLATQPSGAGVGSAGSVAEGDIEALKGFFKGYTVRPASWADVKVGGLPAARYEADYRDKNRDMVEYRTYIVGSRMIYWFVFRVEKDAFAGMKPTIDKIMDAFKVTQ
jgi:hypothetical protein